MTDLEKTGIQTSNACISFFESCFIDELKHAPEEKIRLYELGEKLTELVRQK